MPTADVVHLTGTYNWFLPLAGRLCRRHEKPLVVSPRGSLVAEARGSKGLKKRLFDRLVQVRALSRVSAFHATSEEEARALRELVRGARVAVIPNGVEVPEALPVQEPEEGPYGLYLGRLHPYKRVERIITAFARAAGHSARPTGPPRPPRRRHDGPHLQPGAAKPRRQPELLPPSRLGRQPLLRERLQDLEVPPRIPRPVRRLRRRPHSRRRSSTTAWPKRPSKRGNTLFSPPLKPIQSASSESHPRPHPCPKPSGSTLPNSS